MADDMPMIDVPEVEPEAYDPDRPISGLIHTQLVHLSAAEQCLPEKKRTGINIAMLHTEGEAAAYIQKVTALLHPQGATGRKTKRPPRRRGGTEIGQKNTNKKSETREKRRTTGAAKKR